MAIPYALWPELDPLRRAKEARAYFATHAHTYDDVDQQLYWAFSDTLLWDLLQEFALSRFADTDTVTLLDAGAGTARWSSRVLTELPGCTATLVDLSSDMLAVAERKLYQLGLSERAVLLPKDLQRLEEDELGLHDVVICFHNVLSFVSDPAQTIASLVKATRPGGVIALVVPNYYHAIYFSIYSERWQEIDHVLSQASVKFTDEVPEMFLFTPALVTQHLHNAGAKNIQVFGFPISIYPQFQETQVQGSSTFINAILSDQQHYRQLLDCERRLCRHTEAAARGNNLLAVAQLC